MNVIREWNSTSASGSSALILVWTFLGFGYDLNGIDIIIKTRILISTCLFLVSRCERIGFFFSSVIYLAVRLIIYSDDEAASWQILVL